MVTLEEFIKRSDVSWKYAKAYVMTFDNIKSPSEFKVAPNDWYWKEKITDMGLTESDIKYSALFHVSEDSKSRLGYSLMQVYLRPDKSVLCVEFSSCHKDFLNITNELGMVNGVAYKTRKILKSENSVAFFL